MNENTTLESEKELLLVDFQREHTALYEQYKEFINLSLHEPAIIVDVSTREDCTNGKSQ